jgi:hypothetical protein
VAIEELLDLDAERSDLDLVPVITSDPTALPTVESAVQPLPADAKTSELNVVLPQQEDDDDDAVFAGVLDLLDETNQEASSVGVREGEEWPSIGVVSEGEGVAVEVSKADESTDQANRADITDDPQADDGPLLVIPGLELTSRTDVEQEPDEAVTDSDETISTDLESLGELRFADPD